MVPSQPLDQTNQDRSEGDLAWPDGHVSDGGTSGKKRDMSLDVVSDGALEMVDSLARTVSDQAAGEVSPGIRFLTKVPG